MTTHDDRTGFSIGIDLGTATSTIAMVANDGTPPFTHRKDGFQMPSAIAILPDGTIATGTEALNQAQANPAYSFESVQRRLGSDWHVERSGVSLTADVMVAALLARLCDAAETQLGVRPAHAVLAVPSGYSAMQTQAMLTAATHAGLTVQRMIGDSIASAFSFAQNCFKDGLVLVLDIGAGATDAAVIEVADLDDMGLIEIRTVDGDPRLGGHDWRNILLDHILDETWHQHRIDLTSDIGAMHRLRHAAELAMLDLSAVSSTEIHVPYPHPSIADLSLHVSRAAFEEMTEDLLLRTQELTEGVIAESGGMPDEILLAGGATRIPAIERWARNLVPTGTCRHVPQDSVAVGAAVQAGIMEGQFAGPLVIDVLARSIGIGTIGGYMTWLITRNTAIPALPVTVALSTTRSDQSSVLVQIAEGGHERIEDNVLLATFELNGLPPLPSGWAVGYLTISIDSNHTVALELTDTISGRVRSLKIDPSLGRNTETGAPDRFPAIKVTKS